MEIFIHDIIDVGAGSGGVDEKVLKAERAGSNIYISKLNMEKQYLLYQNGKAFRVHM